MGCQLCILNATLGHLERHSRRTQVVSLKASASQGVQINLQGSESELASVRLYAAVSRFVPPAADAPLADAFGGAAVSEPARVVRLNWPKAARSIHVNPGG